MAQIKANDGDNGNCLNCLLFIIQQPREKWKGKERNNLTKLQSVLAISNSENKIK